MKTEYKKPVTEVTSFEANSYIMLSKEVNQGTISSVDYDPDIFN